MTPESWIQLKGSNEKRTRFRVVPCHFPGNAVIELDCGLEVFFKPSVNGITESSLNHNVKFNLGFSYDGLRADNESVTLIV